MAGTERLSPQEFRAKMASGEFQIGKKGKIVASSGSFPAAKVSAPPKPLKPEAGDKKHKFNAKMVGDEMTGKKATTLEDKHAKEYRLMLKEGLIAVYAQQVEIMLVSPRTGGKHKYICDHLLLHWDGTQEYIDSKGFETKEYIKKVNWMKSQFLPNNPLAVFKARKSKETIVYEAKKKARKKSPRATKKV